MSKNHLKSPPALYFPEHCRPLCRITCKNHLPRVLFRSMLGNLSKPPVTGIEKCRKSGNQTAAKMATRVQQNR